MQVKQIEFQFKGNRDYIHGTDMFNRMTSLHSFAHIKNIRFTVHSIVRSPLCQVYLTEKKEELNDIKNICARCQFDADGSSYWLGLTATEPESGFSGGRYPYDEDCIINLCHMEQDKLSLTQASPFTFIETVVAMNKHLHQQLFPGASGKWMFTGIDLIELCNKHEHLEIHLKHNMNYRLTKSDILVRGKKLGNIFFSLVKA